VVHLKAVPCCALRIALICYCCTPGMVCGVGILPSMSQLVYNFFIVISTVAKKGLHLGEFNARQVVFTRHVSGRMNSKCCQKERLQPNNTAEEDLICCLCSTNMRNSLAI
jgi:hypothetical protein